MADPLRQEVCRRAQDRQTGLLTRMFHPRRDAWHEHFKWEGPFILDLTDVGRVTVAVLTFNTPSRIAARATLIDEGKIVLRSAKSENRQGAIG